MKNTTLILAAIFTLALASSCEKDNDEPQTNLNKESFCAKWDVIGKNDYKSFEFNQTGNYIVIMDTNTKSLNSQSILFGTYEIGSDNTVVLSDFGELVVSEIGDNSISFTLQPIDNPANEILINASKHEEMENTPRTALMCRTWEIFSKDGVPVEGTEWEATVLFTNASTYFVTWVDGEVGLSNWKWKDASEAEFLYTWAENPNWQTAGSVEVPELTTTTLKMIVVSSGREYVLHAI